MGRSKLLIIAVSVLVVLTTIGSISFANGWRVTLRAPDSSVPSPQEPFEDNWDDVYG